MASFKDIPAKAQVGIIVGVAVLLSVGLYFGLYKTLDDANRQKLQMLEAKERENKDLERFERDMPKLNHDIEALKMQLEIQRRIVPDEKEADKFMHMMQDEASKAGIEIRRYTARPVASREFYVEVPWDIDIDGPYYSVLNFFERVANLDRIINIAGLQMGSIAGKGDVKAKRRYAYAPGETVVATCVATTFFSHEAGPPQAPAAAAKK